MTGLLYLEGQLDAGRASEVAAHLALVRRRAASCSTHSRREGVWLREALAAEEESIPARVIAAPEQSGRPTGGGWAAFGLVAFGGAYTIWSGFIDPWLAQASQAGFTQGNLLTMLFFTGTFWKGWDAMRSFNGIHGHGHSGVGRNLAVAEAVATFHGDRVRDGRAGVSRWRCRRPAGRRCRDVHTAIPFTRSPPARR